MVRLKCGRSWVPSRGRVKSKTTKLVFVAYLLTTKHSRVASTTRLAQNQENVPEWSDMFTRRLLFHHSLFWFLLALLVV